MSSPASISLAVVGDINYGGNFLARINGTIRFDAIFSLITKLKIMCIFGDYLRQQDELKGMQKEIIIVSKNYNNELKIFQKGNIIDSHNAEKVKLKYDELQEANQKISEKQ